MADLEAAIQRYQEALDTTPADHPDRAGRLYDLGAGYRLRYQRTGTMTDLEVAIQRFQEALDTTSADHPDRAGRLKSLGAGYRLRYQRTGTMTDLEVAIQRFQEALDTTSADHPDRAGRLKSLGTGYRLRYQRTGMMVDLEAAIQRFQEALDTTPADHPDRAGRLKSLGAEYGDRYLRTGTMVDLEAAIQRCQEALDQFPSPVRDRLRAGRFLLIFHAEAKNWPQAYQAAFKTVSLVPLLTPRSLVTSDKQYLLTEIIDLASIAAAMALNAAKTSYDAVQALELGRGVITGSINELRAEISDLQQHHPQLAEVYVTLRDQLDSPARSTQREVDQRHSAGQELERVIQKIRRLPDFDRFLLAPSEAELKTAAKFGPIIIINVSDYRCDALIFEKTRIHALQLPYLHVSDIRARVTGREVKPEVLEWLWKTVTGPILDTLGFTKTPSSGCWPHIWWIPTGLLAKLPLHAAGYHSKGLNETVLDRVMSSYSSSIKTIVHGRSWSIPEAAQSANPQALLIAMQYTPKKNPLPSTVSEKAMVRLLCKSMELHPVEPGRHKQDVVSHLPNCKIFHFAGHGSTAIRDPSQSYLLLEDWESDKLTVANLLEMNIRKHSPFLAYLSACGTGQIQDENFFDESIHLISAIQLAGFRHVIGTLWDVEDNLSQDMARLTYEGIRDEGMTDESVCKGLHKATRELRDRWLNVSYGAKVANTSIQNAREEDEGVTRGLRDGNKRHARMPWKISESTSDNRMQWVPYVHFGV